MHLVHGQVCSKPCISSESCVGSRLVSFASILGARSQANATRVTDFHDDKKYSATSNKKHAQAKHGRANESVESGV